MIPVRIARGDSAYDITIGSGLFGDVGTWASKRLKRESGKILVVSNPTVFRLNGDAVSKSLSRAGFSVSTHLIGDGERFKNFRSLEKMLEVLGRDEFSRTDSIVALGGGVVGDLAGFAASVYRRGIPFLQIPTTLLAMIDSSVGGKTAINTSFGKNVIGSFYQPAGVLIDTHVLRTLSKRDVTAGFCEAIKQGAIGGKPLFRQTAAFLEGPRKDLMTGGADAELVDLIGAQIAFKAKIVQNDESESPKNTSSRSRKILNFGHTFAHALENATDYKYLKHGEAVGYGIMFAAELSKKLELIDQNEVDLLNDVVHRAGVLPAISHIDPSKVIKAFKYDKKHVGESLHWVLLRGIGRPVIIPETDMPPTAVESTLKTTFQM